MEKKKVMRKKRNSAVGFRKKFSLMNVKLLRGKRGRKRKKRA